MKIFRGNSNPALAGGIAVYLGMQLGELEILKFSDGELNVAYLENIRNEDVYIVQSLNSTSDNIIRLMHCPSVLTWKVDLLKILFRHRKYTCYCASSLSSYLIDVCVYSSIMNKL